MTSGIGISAPYMLYQHCGTTTQKVHKSAGAFRHLKLNRKNLIRRISMAIIKRTKDFIDILGPMGNVFELMNYARCLALDHGKDPVDICNRMKSSDYENAIRVFDAEFGEWIDLIR